MIFSQFQEMGNKSWTLWKMNFAGGKNSENKILDPLIARKAFLL